MIVLAKVVPDWIFSKLDTNYEGYEELKQMLEEGTVTSRTYLQLLCSKCGSSFKKRVDGIFKLSTGERINSKELLCFRCSRKNIVPAMDFNRPYPDWFIAILDPANKDVIEKAKKGVLRTSDFVGFKCQNCGKIEVRSVGSVIYRNTGEKHFKDKFLCKECNLSLGVRISVREPFPQWFIDVLDKNQENYQEILSKALDGSLSIVSEVTFICDTCGKPYRRSVHEMLHKSTGKSIKKFCSRCPKCTWSSRRLKRKTKPFPKWFIDALDKSQDDYSNIVSKLSKGEFHRTDNATLKFICTECGKPFERNVYSVINRADNTMKKRNSLICPNCSWNFTGYRKSSFEEAVLGYMNSLIQDLYHRRFECKRNVRILCCGKSNVKYELDLYWPEISLAVECDGYYWHYQAPNLCTGDYDFYSKKFKNPLSKDDPLQLLNNYPDLVDYHLYKTLLAYKQGIVLIHITGDEHHLIDWDFTNSKPLRPLSDMYLNPYTEQPLLLK